MALIQGLRIAVRGDKLDDIGVYFTSTVSADVIRIVPAQLSPNLPGKLQFVLPPAIFHAPWKVKVVTQFSGNKTAFTKEVREYEYPNPIQVLS
jgi:hypothetical protein